MQNLILELGLEVKVKMNLMHKNLWGLLKVTKPTPQDPKLLVNWLKMEDKSNSIIGLSLLDSQFHPIDLEKCLAQIWEELREILWEKSMNENFCSEEISMIVYESPQHISFMQVIR